MRETIKKTAPWVAIVLALLQGLAGYLEAHSASDDAHTNRRDSSAGYTVLVREVESLYRQIDRLEARLARIEDLAHDELSVTPLPSGSPRPLHTQRQIPQSPDAARAWVDDNRPLPASGSGM
jgi:hypothetical protein